MLLTLTTTQWGVVGQLSGANKSASFLPQRQCRNNTIDDIISMFSLIDRIIFGKTSEDPIYGFVGDD